MCKAYTYIFLAMTLCIHVQITDLSTIHYDPLCMRDLVNNYVVLINTVLQILIKISLKYFSAISLSINLISYELNSMLLTFDDTVCSSPVLHFELVN